MTELADYAWLTGPEAADVLAELAEDAAPLHRQLDRLRKVLSVERARLAVEQDTLRRKAATKFGRRATRMFFTDLTLQQATDRWIARYKADCFPPDRLVHDYCTGIGGDLVALGERGAVRGWERAPGIALLAEANLRACGCAGEIRVGDVTEQTPSLDDWWHLDPDRRVDGVRSTHVEWHSPSLEVIERWLRSAPHGALKLAPAAQVPQAWQDAAELEWISRDRECRQLVVWFGNLTTTPGQCRATAITRSSDEDAPPTACGFAGSSGVAPPVASTIRAYVYDTDPAIRAAGLTGALAEKLELAGIAAGASYLTSDEQAEHPLLSCFRVLEVLPLREKELAEYLRERGIGQLEIKKRGVDMEPEKLRGRLKLQGDNTATLLMARQGLREIGILAERCENSAVGGDSCRR